MRFRFLMMWFASTAAAAQMPPPQPAHGPGGSDYSHAGIVTSAQQGAQGWRVFTPSEPVPASAPVVVFCHGWGALDSKNYQAWINHLVRRGNIVIWPNYQDSLLTPAAQFLPNAIAGVRSALATLRDQRGPCIRTCNASPSSAIPQAACLLPSSRRWRNQKACRNFAR